MEVTDARKRLATDGLITNLGPDVLWIGDKDVTTENGYPLAVDASVSIARSDYAYGVSEGTSEVVRLSGGTGVFPKGVDLSDVDLSGVQPLDSDLTAIAALTTTSYGRALLTLANATAADWPTDAEVASAISSALASYETAADHSSSQSAAISALSSVYQPLDSDLTAIAALTTTSYGRAFLALADQAALVALLPSYQPLDSDLTAIASLTTTSYGRALLSLADAASADWVTKALYDANTMLVAHTDNTPVAVTVSANQVVGRGNSGNIKGLTPAETAAIVGTEVFTQAQGINAQTGTTYTLVAGDAGKMVTLSNVSAITLTVPQDSDATIAIGTYIDLYQLGAGQVTVVAGSGATLRVSGLTAKARAQYSRFAVQKVSANTWVVFGDLAAS